MLAFIFNLVFVIYFFSGLNSSHKEFEKNEVTKFRYLITVITLIVGIGAAAFSFTSLNPLVLLVAILYHFRNTIFAFVSPFVKGLK